MAVDLLQPGIGRVLDVRNETASGDVKRFLVDISAAIASRAWKGRHKPGQCAMLSVPGIGECMISACSPHRDDGLLEFAIKNAGRVTSVFHEIEAGCDIGVRGPYGNGFPIDSWKGKSLLFVGGGIGLAPLRSLINYSLERRTEYGPVHIIYGARSPGDLCFKEDLFDLWPGVPGVRVDVTVDRGDGVWKGPVGFVPQFVESLGPSASNCVAITCGPPAMIRLSLQALKSLGFEGDSVFTTLELKMQCGIGKCGRCNIGSKYVCVDGPVFSLAEIGALPQEF